MRSQKQQHATFQPGRVDVPGLLYGSVGLALSIALHWIGVFKRADAWLFDLLHKPLFHEGVPELPSLPLVILLAALFCYGIAFAVLDSPALWRRIVLGITALVLTFAMIPTCAVWNIYFSPFVQTIAVFWSWFCVVLYTEHHQMPCDVRTRGNSVSSAKPKRPDPVNNIDAGSAEIEDQLELMELIESQEEKYRPKPSGKQKIENVSDQRNASIAKKSVKKFAKKSAKKSAKKTARRKRAHKKKKRQ